MPPDLARLVAAYGAAVAALGLRLVGLAGVGLAIRRARSRLPAAEVEFVRGGIADRPAAHAVVDGQNSREVAVIQHDGILLHHRRLGRCNARDRFVRDRAARSFGARWSRAPCKTQAVDFADDGVACNPTQDTSDLARRKPFIPKGFQLFHAFVGPTHRSPLSSLPQDIVPDRRLCTTIAVSSLSLVHSIRACRYCVPERANQCQRRRVIMCQISESGRASSGITRVSLFRFLGSVL